MNHNTRHPGIALKKAAVIELIQMLLTRGYGIEQLPCPERIDLGGVARPSFFRFQPIIFKSLGKSWFPLVKATYAVRLYGYKRVCANLAAQIVRQMKDFIASGYTIGAVIGMDDSPSCGVTRSVDFLSAAQKCVEIGYCLDDMQYPDFETMKSLYPALITTGTGIFMDAIREQIQRRQLDIKMLGFDPWQEAESVEIERIKGSLQQDK